MQFLNVWIIALLSGLGVLALAVINIYQIRENSRAHKGKTEAFIAMGQDNLKVTHTALNTINHSITSLDSRFVSAIEKWEREDETTKKVLVSLEETQRATLKILETLTEIHNSRT